MPRSNMTGGQGQGQGGRGMGRGRGGSGGGGMGRGRSMGRQAGMNAGNYQAGGYPPQQQYPPPQVQQGVPPGQAPPQQQPYAAPGMELSVEQEIEMLKADKKMIEARIQELEQYGGMPALCATVIEEQCTGCGVCMQSCPVGAITISDNNIAEVNTQTCDACGVCVASCPQSAIVIRKRTQD